MDFVMWNFALESLCQKQDALPPRMRSMNLLPGLCPGPAGDLGGPNTSCLTRKETLVYGLGSV